ncbi:AAA family ATPase [Leptolyngbya sp. 7M]|uniref:AAA family ATPase n=1 Tax=Leptolyngbya sp. 7M TaxID=2812896 RepID=UPI001B8D975E|nr:AAA family ATPase [Leptolyngbya sp. 7M]QYO65379.1 AAA family ATPase [Leptolyngbya sp. 7M]
MADQTSDANSIEKFLRELDIRIRARYPLIAINTYEEDRVREALLDLLFQERHKEKPLYFWSRPTGLQTVVDPKEGLQQNPTTIGDTEDPESVLGFIAEQKAGIFLLCDYAPYISPYGQEDAVLVRRLREIAWKLKSTKATVLFVGPSFPDLETLEKEVTQIELELPKETEIEDSIELQLENLKSSGLDIDLTKETQTALLQSLLGLSAGEISNVIAKAVISCNGLNQDSIKVILEEKKNVIRGSGSLTYVHPEPASNLGGYKSLRAILERAAYTFSPRAKARHVEPCKGILLVGLPGCGKDLCKRVASSITNRALLDLDFGSIMGEGGGVIGSSAMSIKRALSIAGTIKGILGISEFEKAVSGMKSSNKTDGGETARTISYLLNWMQDNRDVLVFATANDVRELESEQFRIGRFSYIHFVDLPDSEDRAEIFKVHIKKRQLDPDRFDIEKLVEKSKDFSGSEIEETVKDGVLEAFIDGDREAETRDVLKAAEKLTPTAQMMSEKIEEIRKWARNNIKGVGTRIDNSGIAGNRGDRIYEF